MNIGFAPRSDPDHCKILPQLILPPRLQWHGAAAKTSWVNYLSKALQPRLQISSNLSIRMRPQLSQKLIFLRSWISMRIWGRITKPQPPQAPLRA